MENNILSRCGLDKKFMKALAFVIAV